MNTITNTEPQTTSSPDCVFCRIVAGTIPCHKIYEDDMFLAFLDIRPLSPGHTLIIPKKHYRWVWDVPQSGAYFEIATTIARALQHAYATPAIHAKIVGEEVPHAHIWIYIDPKATLSNTEKATDFTTHLNKLKHFLPPPPKP